MTFRAQLSSRAQRGICWLFILSCGSPAVTRITLPLAGPGELFAMLWLLFRGGRMTTPAIRPSYAT